MTMKNKPDPREVVSKAKAAGADEAEVFISSSRSSTIEVSDQKIEAVDIKEETGLGLRVFKDKRLGFSYTTDLSDASIDEVVEKAVSSSSFSEQDPFNTLPPPSKNNAQLDLYDKKIALTPINKKIEIAKQIENAAYAFDARIKKTEKATFSDSASEIVLVNSNSVEVFLKENSCGGHIEVISEADGLAENGQYYKYVRKFDDLIPSEIGKEAARRATELIGARTVPSAEYDLVMDPVVASQFLEASFALFSADFIQKGKSAFKGKIGGEIGSKALTIIDNGALPNGIASALFDGEGVPTKENILVNEGVLRGYLYDNYTAGKDKANSTGNSIRASFKAIPQVGPTNFYIKPGTTDASGLIRSVSKGIYITRVMGMHTINPISGDFSVGAAGILIKNGAKTSPVRGITIAGNLTDFFRSVRTVGKDLTFFLNFGSPTLLIENISVSGG